MGDRLLIRSINWIITDRCNSRCKICDIWKSGKHGDTTLNDIRRVLDDPIIAESHKAYGSEFDVSIGGGEPFLREDLFDVCMEIDKRYPGSLKTISTNGLLKERILELLRRINGRLKFKLNISIDGDKRVHDKIRGIDGSFRTTVDTIKHIKRLFPAQDIEIKMTLIPDNHNKIAYVERLASSLSCSFSFKPAENMKNYTNSASDLDTTFSNEMICVVKKQLNSIMEKEMGRNMKKYVFYKDMPFYLKKRDPPKCNIADDSVTIMPNGDVFGCIMMDKLGNLRDGIVNVWNGAKAHKQRSMIANGRCPGCMLMCGSYKSYNPDPGKTLNWELTLRCNLDCPMCTQKEARHPNELDTHGAMDVIDSINRLGHVSFLGGETFLRDDIFDIFHYLDRKKVTYEVTTNGTLLDTPKIEKLVGCIGLRNIIFSLDGPKEVHDSLRGNGVFRKTFNAMLVANKLFDVSVATVVLDDNIDAIPELTKILADAGIRKQKLIYPVCIENRDRESSRSLVEELEIKGPAVRHNNYSYLDILRCLRRAAAISKNRGMQLEMEPRIARDMLSRFHRGDIRDVEYVCCRQLDGIRIDPMGNRIICEFIRNKSSNDGGSIREKILRNNLLPICKWCCKVDKEC
ncbi:MAG: hypothetical protein DRO99_03950 [Candidatus Aenigmatarchaeota archaeon]|nr:MAG: hypothetical protein DRO99_03950 [Candidatus Aenigmarchaeota archaeon]